MMKFLIKLFDSVGVLKGIKSRKASMAIAGGSAVAGFIAWATAQGYSDAIVIAGTIVVGVIAVVYIFVQGKQDISEDENLTNASIEVERNTSINYMRTIEAVRSTNEEDEPEKTKGLLDALGKLPFVLLLLFLPLSIACDKQSVDVTEQTFGNAVICLEDNEQGIPQLYGLFEGPSFTDYVDGGRLYDNENITRYVSVHGVRCRETVVEEPKNPGDDPIVETFCFDGALSLEPLEDIQCIKVIGGAQEGIDVFIKDGLCNNGFDLRDITIGHQRTFSLSRNGIPCVVSEEGFVLPDCGVYQTIGGAGYASWESCCMQPKVYEANEQTHPGVCSEVFGY